MGNLKNRRSGEEPSQILPIAAELELFCKSGDPRVAARVGKVLLLFAT